MSNSPGAHLPHDVRKCSAAVSERLVATLQSENQALRCENRDITEELDQAKEDGAEGNEESAAALAEENAKLRRS